LLEIQVQAAVKSSRIFVSVARNPVLRVPRKTPPILRFPSSALPNGMQVVVIPDHRAPVVTQMVWFKVGGDGRSTRTIRSGALLRAYDVSAGTKNRSGRSVCAHAGAKWRRETMPSPPRTTRAFYEQIAHDRLKLAMDLEADRMANLDPLPKPT